jgi:hypothetical protein
MVISLVHLPIIHHFSVSFSNIASSVYFDAANSLLVTYHSQFARLQTCGSPSIFLTIKYSPFYTGVCDNHSFNLSQCPINFHTIFFLRITVHIQALIHACTFTLWTHIHTLPRWGAPKDWDWTDRFQDWRSHWATIEKITLLNFRINLEKYKESN